MAKGGDRTCKEKHKADVTRLADQVKKTMKDGNKTPPKIAEAINALLPVRKKFDPGSLRNRINGWNLHEDATPERYRWANLDGPDIVNLQREERTYPVHGL